MAYPTAPHERGNTIGKPRRRLTALTSMVTLGLIFSMTSATASSYPVDEGVRPPFSGGALPDRTDLGDLEEHIGNVVVTEPGTVIDGMYIRGAINVHADDVTIRDTVVAYGGYHSIRIFPGADGTQILSSDVYCLQSHTNGVVFGDYYAEDTALHGCQHGFEYREGHPAEVVDSTVDGESFELPASPDNPRRSCASSEPQQLDQPPEKSATQSEPPAAEPSEESMSGDSESSRSSEFPDADSTGVPDGISLTPAGSLTITEDGTVIDGLHVRGTITIEADDVVVRNTLVQGDTTLYPIHVTSGASGALIEDVEIDNLGSTGIGVFFDNGSGTLRHVDIHSAEDGVRVQADDVTIEFSFIHDLHRQPGGHHDSIQIRRGDDVTIRGNNLQPYVESTDDPMNAALQIGSLVGSDRISNLVVTGNLMNGGNVTINGGGRNEVDSARYSDNQFGRDFRYGVSGNIQNSIWESSNVWVGTDEPVR